MASDIWRDWSPTFQTAVRALALSPEQGAAGSIRAVTDETLEGGEYLTPYYVPDCLPELLRGLMETHGVFWGPRVSKSSALSCHPTEGMRLWEESVSMLEGYLN